MTAWLTRLVNWTSPLWLPVAGPLYALVHRNETVRPDDPGRMDVVRADAQRGQMLKDCAAVCSKCRAGETAHRDVRRGNYFHVIYFIGNAAGVDCPASPIRTAWAAANGPVGEKG